MHHLPLTGVGPPPLEALGLIFLPSVISMVAWLPRVFCLSDSSSLVSLFDLLPTLFVVLSYVSSSDDPIFSMVFFFFFIIFAYVGEEILLGMGIGLLPVSMVSIFSCCGGSSSPASRGSVGGVRISKGFLSPSLPFVSLLPAFWLLMLPLSTFSLSL